MNDSDMNSTITLREYLEKGKTFVVPHYQRGYVWGKSRKNGEEKDSVSNFLNDVLTRFYNEGEDLFLQGFTVTESENEITLIDGQQRTTCLYLLLKWLGYDRKFKIRYEVRKSSDEFLRSINFNDIREDEKEEFQDIYFFKKTLRIIKEQIKDIDHTKLIDYLLDNIRFLYINISDTQATKTFTMMNGNKALMLPEELIKAEMLRLVSQQDTQNDLTLEWEHNRMRSRYAREWDRWLQWWNREDVKKLYRCEGPMGLLIKSYSKTDVLTFETFRHQFLKSGQSIEAKQCFDGLRRLQKRFEDAFNNIETHNMIGAVLRVFDKDNRNKFLQYYFVDDHRENVRDYYLQVFLGMTHNEIIEQNEEQFEKKYNDTRTAISDDIAYEKQDKEAVFRLLLRLNVDQDSKLGRKFDFQIWKERSLEHIYPKSKVKHKGEDGKWYRGDNSLIENDEDLPNMLDRANIKMKDGESIKTTTEHSIGNLVLLYKNENSAFSNANFAEKKKMFFAFNDKKSLHLLHTICVFAKDIDWSGESIAKNKNEIVNQFKVDYVELCQKYNYTRYEEK